MRNHTATINLAVFVLTLQLAGCSSKTSPFEDSQARWQRGSSRDGYYFVLNADERVRMIREIKKMPIGTSAQAAVSLLGKAEIVYETGDKFPFRFGEPTLGFTYTFTQKYKSGSDEGEDERVDLYFFNGKFTGYHADFEELSVLPDDTFIDPKDAKIVIIGVYPNPLLSEANQKNQHNIKAALRASHIAYEAYPVGNAVQILVSRAHAEEAHNILCRAVQRAEIVARIPGCPSTAKTEAKSSS